MAADAAKNGLDIIRLVAPTTDEARLPLADNSVDKLLVVHCLEVSEQARPLLREIWRVLAPEGQLLLIVPNRNGVWSRREATPFGHGQPYSRTQLERLLQDVFFTPTTWSTALHALPVGHRLAVRWAPALEKFGAKLWPRLAGVILVEARKELASAIPAGAVVKRAPRLATAEGLLSRRDAVAEAGGRDDDLRRSVSDRAG